MTHVTYRLTAKNRDQPRNSVIKYGLPLPFYICLLFYLVYQVYFIIIILPINADLPSSVREFTACFVIAYTSYVDKMA